MIWSNIQSPFFMYSRESESEQESKETDPLTGLSSGVDEVNLMHSKTEACRMNNHHAYIGQRKVTTKFRSSNEKRNIV